MLLTGPPDDTVQPVSKIIVMSTRRQKCCLVDSMCSMFMGLIYMPVRSLETPNTFWRFSKQDI